jgi:hypothetical protein
MLDLLERAEVALLLLRRKHAMSAEFDVVRFPCIRSGRQTHTTSIDVPWDLYTRKA